MTPRSLSPLTSLQLSAYFDLPSGPVFFCEGLSSCILVFLLLRRFLVNTVGAAVLVQQRLLKIRNSETKDETLECSAQVVGDVISEFLAEIQSVAPQNR